MPGETLYVDPPPAEPRLWTNNTLMIDLDRVTAVHLFEEEDDEASVWLVDDDEPFKISFADARNLMAAWRAYRGC